MSTFHLDTEYPEVVRLRPAPATRPVKTIESVEQAGLVLDHAHAIAMYTSRSVPNVGPPGTPGEPGITPDVWDTIIASCSDEVNPITVGGPKTTFRAPFPYDMTNGFVRASLTTAPVGATMIIDITMNGVSIFSGNKLVIGDGDRTSVGAPVAPNYNFPGDAVPDDAEFLVYVDQVGSSFAGAGLKVALTGLKVPI